MMDRNVARALNAAGLVAISLVLFVAFADQLVLGDLPCPLCILQRGAFVAVGITLLLNLRLGPRPSHYGAMILSATVGATVAGRQTMLHIVPGSAGYGMPLLGLHFYVWAFIVFALVITGAAVMLLFDRQFDAASEPRWMQKLAMAMFVLVAVATLGNGVSTVLECGGGLCPDDPTSYELLQEGR
jgi:disulfide bond formation protein DsbB